MPAWLRCYGGLNWTTPLCCDSSAMTHWRNDAGSNWLFTKRVLSFATQDLDEPEDAIRQAVASTSGSHIWGIWHGLFGLAANQLLMVTAHAQDHDGWLPAAGCKVESEWILRSTVRPESPAPIEKSGIYVFRDFWLPPQHVQQAVQLSAQAWQTFEGADSYAAQPMGLFAPVDQSSEGECVLHLLTWYPDFAAWETSRESDPAAKKRFMARRALTRTTSAVATRLRLPR